MKLIRNALFLTLAATSIAHAEVDLKPSNSKNESAATFGTINSIDSTQEVAYTCQSGNKQKIALTAMYGIKDNEVVVAQVKLGGQTSPGLWRVPDVLLNRFVSQDANALPTMWTTMPATPEQLAQVDGGKLSYTANKDNAQTIIVENCKLDKAATAKLKR
ncbi:hypothetical protein ACKLNO_10865 [Neisseriaceae bacterium B1]